MTVRIEEWRLEAQKNSMNRDTITYPDSFLEFKKLIKLHPFLKESKDFEKECVRVEKYYKLMSLLQENPRKTTRELANYCKLPESTASYWIRNCTVPSLMRKLMNNEKHRKEHLYGIPSEALIHRIDSAIIHQELKQFRKQSNQSIKSVASALARLQTISNQVFSYFEFRHWNKHEEEWLIELMHYIQKHLYDIKQELNKISNAKSRTKFQIAIIKDRMYMRGCGNNPNLHFDLLEKELFYFKKSKRDQMIRELTVHSGGLGIVRLSQLIGQLTNHKNRKIPSDGIYPDLKPDKSYLMGETLKFYIDLTGLSIEDITPIITQLGKQKQIIKPQILSNRAFLILTSRLFAIIGSDGHIQKSIFRCQYSEYDSIRRNQVAEIISTLGNFSLRNRRLPNGELTGFYIPSVIGRLLINLGMPAGDKVLQGVRLPLFISNGSIEVKTAYLQEVIPEEGCIVITKHTDRAYILIGRRTVLYENRKARSYGFVNKLSANLVEFIRKKGVEQKRNFGLPDFSATYIVLTPPRLRKLKHSGNPEIQFMASELEHVIESHPPSYLIDEQALCRSIGIETKERWTEITYSRKTGRISVAWQFRTRRQKDAARWGLLAIPNDTRKHAILAKWMQRHYAMIEEVKKQIPFKDFSTCCQNLH